MADENIRILPTPEAINSRRNSVGLPPGSIEGEKSTLSPSRSLRASLGPCHVVGNSRRNSTGKSTSQNGGETIIPHYLRASTGSCHDFCKYGRKHSNEVKPWKSKPQRAVTSSSDKQTTAVVLGEKKRTTTLKLKPSPNPESLSHELPSDKQNNTTIVPGERKRTTMANSKPYPDPTSPSHEPLEIIKREVLLPSQEGEISSKRDSSVSRKSTEDELKLTAKRGTSVKPKPVVVKVSPSLSDVSVGVYSRRITDVKTKKKSGTLPKAAVKKVIVIPTTSLSPKSSLSRALSLKTRKSQNLKQVSPLKDQNRMSKAEPKLPSSDNAQDKPLQVFVSETENKVIESVQLGDTVQSFPGLPSLSAPSSSSQSSLTISPKSSPHKDSQGSDSEEDLEYSEYTISEAEEDDFISDNDLEPSKEDGEALRKGRAIHPEEKDVAMVKLKFRRGKIVDLQAENSGPRRLKFRQRRVFGDDVEGQGDSRRRTYKKRGDSATKESRVNSEKIVLKHQDVQGKKDSQSLFNDVIEETASKLVETRKSKVKALVGAFETVISLQDSKLSTQTVT